MEETLKFRIWDKQNKCFVYNNASLHCESNWVVDASNCQILNFVRAIDGDNGSDTYTLDINPDYYADGLEIIKEPRYILTKYTGRNDKNDKEIYEGDIIRFSLPNEKSLLAKVIRENQTTNLVLEVIQPCGKALYPLNSLSNTNKSETEIVANIFKY